MTKALVIIKLESIRYCVRGLINAFTFGLSKQRKLLRIDKEITKLLEGIL